jgi:alkylation response protein AidB-like acyl-CoA dehydrogenase
MDFTYTEEQEMLRKMAREFLEKECTERFIRDMEKDEKGYSPDLWKKIADLGWLGLAFPEKYGGTAGTVTDLCVLYEEFGRSMFPSPHFSTVVLCGLTILNAGTEEQKSEFLRKIVNGGCIMSLAFTEPETSWNGRAWDPDGVTMRARQDGDDYTLNGVKLFVHDAAVADYLLVVARTRATRLSRAPRAGRASGDGATTARQPRPPPPSPPSSLTTSPCPATPTSCSTASSPSPRGGGDHRSARACARSRARMSTT